MSVKEEGMSDLNDEVYSTHTIKIEPMSPESEDQFTCSLIKVEKGSVEDTNAVSTHDECNFILEVEVKKEEPCETLKEEEQIDSSIFQHWPASVHDIDKTDKVEIEIGPTVIQPQYIGSSLHTTDASKAELIQCGGADVTLDTTTPVFKRAKTNAQKCREYRLRKKILKAQTVAQDNVKKKPPPKTAAERKRQYLMRQKLLKSQKQMLNESSAALNPTEVCEVNSVRPVFNICYIAEISNHITPINNSVENEINYSSSSTTRERHGVSNLIIVHDQRLGRSAKTGAERMREYRERKRNESHKGESRDCCD